MKELDVCQISAVSGGKIVNPGECKADIENGSAAGGAIGAIFLGAVGGLFSGGLLAGAGAFIGSTFGAAAGGAIADYESSSCKPAKLTR